ncbi:MAG: isoleucine--tRNA ligase [Gemmatimonadetes bacterium]|nr:isoleucine--tRNA ligase [Gemmatimonadota bacterium]
MKYPEYPQSAVALEEELLAHWRREHLFRQTLERRANDPEFVFFEGPPTANGRPGIHHVISRAIKDLVCRYQAMRGHYVTRIAGWDTHGLPVEIEAEKKLGISGKRQIEELGVATFNQVCRDSVFTYKEDWERLSERIGYWLDYSHPYVTFHSDYIESVWNIFQRLDRKGLLYRGYKSVPYCPRCGTALSSHEVAQGYEDIADPSIYFTCPLEDDPGRAFLVWTTTPWTLPSNVALALHPRLTYVEIEHEGQRLILAESRVAALFGEDRPILARYTARELADRRYRRVFDIVPVAPAERAFRVVLEEFVTADDGTGIVHLAPAFGADDYQAGQRHGLPLLRPVDDAARFLESIPLVGGVFVKAADETLVEDLRARGRVFRYTHEVHTYPHCWRCKSPLIYMARDSWYLRTTACQQEMIANNRQVAWHPAEIGSGRFGEWLEGNVDWAISRERYWGTPLPVWVCSTSPEHVQVIGSYAELAEHAGPLAPDFDPHKPWIDELTWPCPHCPGTMRRTPEVIDVWFDSGAMPYAQWHYPMEHQAEWRRHFPADFICEGVDQTRGWFYSLMAISSMLGDGPAYRHVLVNDLLLDDEGQKMSKSRGNTVDPDEAIRTFGADAIRWYFVTVSQPWVPKRFDAEALGEAARRTFDTLANTYRFFALYANLEGWEAGAADPPPAERSVLDRWVLSRLASLTGYVEAELANYEITRAARAIGDFIVDDLSNWYVRRSRDRFWGSADAADTRAAFRTLHETLLTLARLLAPVVPFLSDWLYRALAGGESVHLASYPVASEFPRDEHLETGMRWTRVLSRLGRAARERVKIRVRQPLGVLQAVIPDAAAMSEDLLAVLRDELNVREVQFLQAAEELVTLRATPRFRELGKRFGGRTQEAAAAIRALDPAALRPLTRGEPVPVQVGGSAHLLTLEDLELHEEARGELVVESGEGATLALDPHVTEELRLEGLARELVNRIQRLRRDSGLEVSDRILLRIFAAGDLRRAAEQHAAYIAGETLATDYAVGAPAAGVDAPAVDIDGEPARIALRRAG